MVSTVYEREIRRGALQLRKAFKAVDIPYKQGSC